MNAGKKGKKKQPKSNGRRRANGGASTKQRAAANLNGVGKTVSALVSATARNGSSHAGSKKSLMEYWDATIPKHLPLPRAIGPYVPMVLTTVIETRAPFIIFGTWGDLQNTETGVQWGGNRWMDVVALECDRDEVSKKINPAFWWISNPNASVAQIAEHQASFKVHKHEMLSSGAMNGAEVVPSALTVQLVNGNSLQQTNGINFMGVCKTNINDMGRDISPKAIGNSFVNTMCPRMLANSKLALRGVKCSSYPLDMAELADFRDVSRLTPGAGENDGDKLSWGKNLLDSSGQGHHSHKFMAAPMGFAPIVFYNKSAATDGVSTGDSAYTSTDPVTGQTSTIKPLPDKLTFIVTTEFRTRFELGNPASSTHKSFPVTSDHFFDQCVKAAASAGHAVVDIAEAAVVGRNLFQAAGVI